MDQIVVTQRETCWYRRGLVESRETSVETMVRKIVVSKSRGRRGAASLDYVLVLAVILPMIVFMMWSGPRIMRLAYDMVAMLVSWPFM